MSDLIFNPKKPPKDVQDWYKEFRKVMSKMPDSLTIQADGDLHFCVKRKDGKDAIEIHKGKCIVYVNKQHWIDAGDPW